MSFTFRLSFEFPPRIGVISIDNIKPYSWSVICTVVPRVGLQAMFVLKGRGGEELRVYLH